MTDSIYQWQIRDQVLALGRTPLVMGIVNVTPDSFSDGGQFTSIDAAVSHALQLVQDGADLLDIGGESTRPGSMPVPHDEEARRVIPVLQRLVKEITVPLSVDTSKAAVARAGLESGARIINDVTGLAGDPDMLAVVRSFRAGAIVMHMQGTPATMQLDPQYEDVTHDVADYFEQRLQDLADHGIAGEQIVLDPGIGFGKTRDHNLELLARLGEFRKLGRPLCLGVSRKGILGRVLNRPVDQRLAGSLAAVLYAMTCDAAHIVRVHDVRETRDAITMVEAIRAKNRPAAEEGSASV